MWWGERTVAAVAAVAVAMALPAASGAAGTAREPGIGIVVNGQSLPARVPARIVGGRLMLPVGAVYRALGIGVRRNGEDLVLAAGGQQIVLRMGSTRALIDGVPLALDAPVTLIDGAAYVSRRFVADSLGARIGYAPHAAQVEIISTLAGRNPGDATHADRGSQLVGTLSAIDRNSVPESISVERAGSVRTIAVTDGASIALEDVVARTNTPGSLGALHVGDAVSVFLRPDGQAGSVVARYASRTGTIAAVSPSLFVLSDGFMVAPDRSTQITLNGESAGLAELRVGDAVTVRLNPDTNEKREIVAVRADGAAPAASPGPVAIVGLTVGGKPALRGGDALEVTLRGTPGGRATYDIGAFLLGLPMTEDPSGTYRARYTVPPDVNFGSVQVVGHLVVGGVAAPAVAGGTLIAISTMPPEIVEVAPAPGQTINNNRPSIFATYRSPTDIGIDPASATLIVDGRDVSAAATRAAGFLTYSPEESLHDGPITVVVRVSDRAGNVQQRSWSFAVHSR